MTKQLTQQDIDAAIADQRKVTLTKELYDSVMEACGALQALATLYEPASYDQARCAHNRLQLAFSEAIHETINQQHIAT